MRTPLLQGSQRWKCFHQEDCDTHRILRINGYYNDSHVAKKAAAIKKKKRAQKFKLMHQAHENKHINLLLE